MKIADKIPRTVKRPVRIKEDEYHLYYSKPVNLGKIMKKGIYWYTEDGMRFVSSRDALEYRIRVVESIASGKEPDALDKEQLAKTVRRKKKAPARASANKTVAITDPMYQKFLEFMKAQGQQAQQGDGDITKG